MIVCHLHEFVFIKTRKTAGTSVEIALSSCCNDGDVITPVSKKDEILRAQEDGFGPCGYKRPIWDYPSFFLRAGLGQKRSQRGRLSMKYWNHAPAAYVRDLLGPRLWKRYTTFTIERNPWDRAISDYYWRAPVEKNGIRQPMTEWLREITAPGPHPPLSNWDLYADEGGVIIDKVMQYENLASDCEEIWKDLGLKKRDTILPKKQAKSSSREDRRKPSEVLNDEQAGIIEAACWREIEFFGYIFR